MKLFDTNTQKSQNHSDKRVCERLNIQKELKLYLINNDMLECKSTDISLGGINLISNTSIDTNYLGTDAALTINEADKLFNCKIVRINDNQLAVEIDKKQAASFGMTLTQNMFTR